VRYDQNKLLEPVHISPKKEIFGPMSMQSGYIISCANIAVIEGFTQQREVIESDLEKSRRLIRKRNQRYSATI